MGELQVCYSWNWLNMVWFCWYRMDRICYFAMPTTSPLPITHCPSGCLVSKNFFLRYSSSSLYNLVSSYTLIILFLRCEYFKYWMNQEKEKKWKRKSRKCLFLLFFLFSFCNGGCWCILITYAWLCSSGCSFETEVISVSSGLQWVYSIIHIEDKIISRIQKSKPPIKKVIIENLLSNNQKVWWPLRLNKREINETLWNGKNVWHIGLVHTT